MFALEPLNEMRYSDEKPCSVNGNVRHNWALPSHCWTSYSAALETLLQSRAIRPLL